MINLILFLLVMIVIVSIYLILFRKEKYTFADYDKFPPCWCNRNLDIVWFYLSSINKINEWRYRTKTNRINRC